MKRFLFALLGLVTAAVITMPTTSYANIDPMTGRAYGDGNSGYSPVRRKLVDFKTRYPKGTIVVKTGEKRLYLVQGNGKALRYGVGVGRPGFQWHGTHRITRKAEWPGWTPPAAMRKRVPNLPAYMPGGPRQPAGRTCHVHRFHAVSHPRLQRALDDRARSFLRLHSHDEFGREGSLQPRARRRPRGCYPLRPSRHTT